MGTALFWALAVLPALLYPVLLVVYLQRVAIRKQLIQRLVDRSRTPRRTRLSPDQAEARQVEWKSQLDVAISAYVYPALIATLLTLAGMVTIIAQGDPSNQLGLPRPLLDYASHATPASIAGFAGAYVWTLFDLVDRFRLLNLQPAAVHALWFRLLLGPVLGGYAQALLADKFAPVLIFALMALPVSSILKWLQDLASQRFNLAAHGLGVSPQWELVQGLTPDIVARLVEAGVSNAAHLGNQDPVTLLRRTNIEWLNVLDMMDQAYLAGYVGSAIAKLRARGIRGAIEMALLWPRSQSGDPAARANAEDVIRTLAADLATDEASVRNLLRNLWEDPQVDRIWSLWFERDPDALSLPTSVGAPAAAH